MKLLNFSNITSVQCIARKGIFEIEADKNKVKKYDGGRAAGIANVNILRKGY